MFIGIIAVVRRVVVITAEDEHLPEDERVLTNLLLELGLLGLLVVAFGTAIYPVRRGAAAARRAAPPATPQSSARGARRS